MKKVLVTGSNGFIGKNLTEALSRRGDVEVYRFDTGHDEVRLRKQLEDVGIVYHLAGVNRPKRVDEFEKKNVGLTGTIVALLEDLGKETPIAFASSTQALQDNPYGISKKKAEDILWRYGQSKRAPVYIYRLTNVFGKWSRPDYNSVVATFCYNVSHDLPITVSARNTEIELVYIDDVVASFLEVLDEGEVGDSLYREVGPSMKISLGDLADQILQFRDSRETLVMPDLSDELSKRLYATYLSYLEGDDLAYALKTKSDERGNLTEVIKSNQFGQIFVSTTRAGVTRGNHYHDTKIEKFLVLQGEALIKLRHVLDDEVISYRVSGSRPQVVDIPPGFTHSIENLSDGEMTVMFWSGSIFNSDKADTYFREV